MRLREALLQAAAAIVASGCTGHTLGSSSDAAVPSDSSEAADASPSNSSSGSSGGGSGGSGSSSGVCAPQDIDITVDAAVACAIAQEDPTDFPFHGNACWTACNQPTWQLQLTSCALPQSYVAAFNALRGDGGASASDAGDAGADGSLPADCPQVAGPIPMACGYPQTCGGRRTEGFSRRGHHPRAGSSDGERLAHMAWLEAVSVHAFERLERELAAHGGPPALRRDARRARRDEVRHTAITTRLARRRGATPAVPDRPPAMPVRALVDVAVENAVEGCVRETYGALVALVEALSSPDRSLRRAMRAIGADESRHAELAWAVHAWAMPRLTEDERRAVARAMKDAIAQIAASDPRAASVLFS